MKSIIREKFLDKNIKNIVLLFIAQAINVIGDDFFNIAVMWIVYSESKSTLITSIIGVVWHLTDILISPIAGVFADTKDKKKIVFFSNIIAFLISILIGIFILYTKKFPIILAIISIAALNILTSFITPTRSSLVIKSVDKDKLKKVNGAFSSIIQISSIIGSGLGGVILSTFGIGLSVMLNSFSYLIVIICFMFFNWEIKEHKVENEGRNIKIKYSFINDFKLGIKYLKRKPVLIKLSIFLVLLNGISFLGTLYPAIVFENLGDNAKLYGFIQMAGTFGAILGGLILTIKKIENNKLYIIFCLIGLSISLVGLALSKSYVISLIMSFTQYMLITINSIIINTIIMINVESKYIGRMLGLIKSISIVIIPITTIMAGWLGTIVKVQNIFIVSAIYIIGIVMITPYLINE